MQALAVGRELTVFFLEVADEVPFQVMVHEPSSLSPFEQREPVFPPFPRVFNLIRPQFNDLPVDWFWVPLYEE